MVDRRPRRPREPPRADHRVVAVVGPPCSGKSTFVDEHRRPGDVVIDFDRIAQAFGSQDPHHHADVHVQLTLAAKASAVHRFLRSDAACTLWLIVTRAGQCTNAGVIPARVHTMTTPIEECLRRADEQGRTERVKEIIRTWQP